MAALQWDSAGKTDPAAVRSEGWERGGGGGEGRRCGMDEQPSKIKTALLLVRKNHLIKFAQIGRQGAVCRGVRARFRAFIR